MNVLGFDWGRLLSPRPLMGPEFDSVEAEIVALERQALPPAGEDGGPKLSANGSANGTH